MELTRSQVLEKRTTKLAINILDLCKKYPKSFLTNDILPAVNRGVSFGHPDVFSVRLHPRNQLRGIQRAANNTIGQLLRSGTSIGANYREANGASSKRDFKNKILICKRECKETEYWLQMLANTNDSISLKETCRKLWQETHEFTLIFSKSAANTIFIIF